MRIVNIYILVASLLVVSCGTSVDESIHLKSVTMFNSSYEKSAPTIDLWFDSNSMTIKNDPSRHYCNRYDVTLKPREFHKVSVGLDDGTCAYPITEDVPHFEKQVLKESKQEGKVILLMEAIYKK